MGYQERRKLIRVGTSKAALLPKPGVDYHGERAQWLTLLGDATLVVAPKGMEGKLGGGWSWLRRATVLKLKSKGQ